MRVKPEDHPSTLNREGLGSRLGAAGYSLSTRGPTRLPDGSLDETVELTVALLDGSEPGEAQAIEAAALVKADSGAALPEVDDEPARVYIRGGKVYAEDENGNTLLLGSLTQ